MLPTDASPDPNQPTPAPNPALAAAQPTQQTPAAPAQTTQTAPNPATNPALLKQVAHDSFIGRLAKSVLGTQQQYSVDPKTGQTVSSPMPSQPGALWKHMVGGAILGMAAGSQAKDFAGGVGRGGAAVMQSDLEANQRRQQAARQDFEQKQKIDENQRQQQTQQLEQDRFKAQTAVWNNEELARESDANIRSEEILDNENARSEDVRKAAQEAGGQLAPIPDNGVPDNGAKMAQLYTSDPSKFQAPNGYQAVLTKSYDHSSLKYNFKGNGWEDDKGQAADLKDHTTWTLQYVPNEGAKQPISMTYAQIKKAYPKVGANLPDKGTWTTTMEGLVGLAHTESEWERTIANDDRARNHSEAMAVIDASRQSINDLNDQLKSATAEGDAATVSKINSELDEQRDLLKTAISQLDPAYRAAVERKVAAGQLPTPPQKGAPIDDASLAKYLSASGNDRTAAIAAAQKAGWGPPQAGTANNTPQVSPDEQRALTGGAAGVQTNYPQ